jgi:hypothetical protein
VHVLSPAVGQPPRMVRISRPASSSKGSGKPRVPSRYQQPARRLERETNSIGLLPTDRNMGRNMGRFNEKSRPSRSGPFVGWRFGSGSRSSITITRPWLATAIGRPGHKASRRTDRSPFPVRGGCRPVFRKHSCHFGGWRLARGFHEAQMDHVYHGAGFRNSRVGHDIRPHPAAIMSSVSSKIIRLSLRSSALTERHRTPKRGSSSFAGRRSMDRAVITSMPPWLAPTTSTPRSSK